MGGFPLQERPHKNEGIMSPNRLKKVAKCYLVVSGVTVQGDGLESSPGMDLGLYLGRMGVSPRDTWPVRIRPEKLSTVGS